jgi:hypothetical protein
MSNEKSCCCSASSCCNTESITPYEKNDEWVMGEIHTPKGSVPVVSTNLHFKDILGAWKVRWGIGRMNYKINPGLYAIGKPDHTSPVLVSANYKLTFDVLRKELSGLDCWILILDTKGINVWCAAGKGTFGTHELVGRILKTGLSEIVSHRKLVLPQLGAPGVSAHEVTKQTGFSVVYGPVRAKAIKTFLDSGFKATQEMRTVKFTMGTNFRTSSTTYTFFSRQTKRSNIFQIYMFHNVLLYPQILFISNNTIPTINEIAISGTAIFISLITPEKDVYVDEPVKFIAK